MNWSNVHRSSGSASKQDVSGCIHFNRCIDLCDASVLICNQASPNAIGMMNRTNRRRLTNFFLARRLANSVRLRHGWPLRHESSLLHWIHFWTSWFWAAYLWPNVIRFAHKRILIVLELTFFTIRLDIQFSSSAVAHQRVGQHIHPTFNRHLNEWQILVLSLAVREGVPYLLIWIRSIYSSYLLKNSCIYQFRNLRHVSWSLFYYTETQQPILLDSNKQCIHVLLSARPIGTWSKKTDVCPNTPG